MTEVKVIMFGMEEQKDKEGVESFVFELEQDLTNAEKRKEIQQHIIAKMQKVKSLLRDGEDQEVFDRLGTVLYGYMAAQSVIDGVKLKNS